LGNIAAIAEIADKQAKEITSRVQKKRELNEDSRPFGDILQEEIDKLNNEKTTKELGKATSVEN